VDWLIGALLLFALFWTVATVTGHSIVWVAVAWGVVVLAGAMVFRALDRRRAGD
jgi:high-affinity Fe2+/Pb2+ permease